jgi:hypothetical protein
MRSNRIIEKHEGPEDWDSVLNYYDPEFMEIQGRPVLLPLGKEHHPNITILRCIMGDNGQSLTLFLKDTTFVEDPRCEFFLAGRIAVCDKLDDVGVNVAIVYHEWFIIGND